MATSQPANPRGLVSQAARDAPTVHYCTVTCPIQWCIVNASFSTPYPSPSLVLQAQFLSLTLLVLSLRCLVNCITNTADPARIPSCPHMQLAMHLQCCSTVTCLMQQCTVLQMLLAFSAIVNVLFSTPHLSTPLFLQAQFLSLTMLILLLLKCLFPRCPFFSKWASACEVTMWRSLTWSASTSRMPSTQCWVAGSTGHIVNLTNANLTLERSLPLAGRVELRNDVIHIHYPYICQHLSVGCIQC